MRNVSCMWRCYRSHTAHRSSVSHQFWDIHSLQFRQVFGKNGGLVFYIAIKFSTIALIVLIIVVSYSYMHMYICYMHSKCVVCRPQLLFILLVTYVLSEFIYSDNALIFILCLIRMTYQIIFFFFKRYSIICFRRTNQLQVFKLLLLSNDNIVILFLSVSSYSRTVRRWCGPPPGRRKYRDLQSHSSRSISRSTWERWSSTPTTASCRLLMSAVRTRRVKSAYIREWCGWIGILLYSSEFIALIHVIITSLATVT